MRFVLVGASLYMFRDCRFSLIASFTALFYHGTVGLDERPPVRGICSVPGKVMAAVKLCAHTFPQTFISVQSGSVSKQHSPCVILTDS